MPPLSVVCWKWGTLFGPEYVNRLASMLRRHLRAPYTLSCITDDPSGIDCEGLGVAPVQMEGRFDAHAGLRAGNRACFRRLRLLGKDMADVFGPRVLQLDLDVVLVGDVTPLFDRPDPLVLVEQANTGTGRVTHNPSMLLMDAGVLDGAWAEFDAAPLETWHAARDRGWGCSDMAVINDYVARNAVPAATWGEADGVQAYWRPENKQLRPGARAVLFFGRANPGDADVQAASPWISEYWV